MKPLIILSFLTALSSVPLMSHAQGAQVSTDSSVRGFTTDNNGRRVSNSQRPPRSQPAPQPAPQSEMPPQTQPQAPQIGTPTVKKEVDENRNVVNPVENPVPTTIRLNIPADKSYNADLWTATPASSNLIFPPQWIWEHGGWDWDERRISWRLGDSSLQWNSSWTRPVTSNTPLTVTQEKDIIGEKISYAHFEDWLPVEKAYHCEAILSYEYALKIHKLTLLSYEKYSLDTLKAKVCSSDYTSQ